MPYFRKKPIVVEARQFMPDTQADVAGWCDENGADVVLGGRATPSPWMQISTSEGRMIARYGDWIIKGIHGELYPCKSDIFKATYDPAGA